MDPQQARLMSAVLSLYTDNLIAFKNVVEFSLLATGRKKVIRLVGGRELFKAMSELASANALSIVRSKYSLKTIFTTATSDRFQTACTDSEGLDEEFVMFVGVGNNASTACSMESTDYSDRAAAEMYGYPACCAQAYARISGGEHWMRVFLGDTTRPDYPYAANKIGSIFRPYLSLLPDYFPCSPGCVESISTAINAESSLVQLDMTDFLPVIRKSLTALCLLLGNRLWYIREYDYAGETREWTNLADVSTVLLDGVDDDRSSPPLRIAIRSDVVHVDFEDRSERFDMDDKYNRFVYFV